MRTVNRVSDICPALLSTELLRVARIRRDWIEVDTTLLDYTAKERVGYAPGDAFACRYLVTSPLLRHICKDASDVMGCVAMSTWLIDGPKIARPSIADCAALEQVEINLTVPEYSQPFPAILVNFPTDGKFYACLCCQYQGLLITSLHSYDAKDDIVTIIRHHEGRMIEESVCKYDANLADVAETSKRHIRIALNLCLLMTGHPLRVRPALPVELESDTRLAKEGTPRGERARKRLPLATSIVEFEHSVEMFRTEKRASTPGEPTGTVVKPHWRRGHWAMQPYGERQSLRKRILRPPVFVHPERFTGEHGVTVYQ